MAFFSPPAVRVDRFKRSVSVALLKRSVRKYPDYYLSVRIGEMAVQSHGLSIGDRVIVQWGHGDDFGVVRISKVERGGVMMLRKQHGKKPARSLCFGWRKFPLTEMKDAAGGVWRFPFKTQDAIKCEWFQLPDGSLGVRLPHSWFEKVRDGKKSFGWSKAA